MSFRLLASIMGLCVVACGGSTQVPETTTPSGTGSSLAESMPWPKDALKAAKAAPAKPTPARQRDTKTAAPAKKAEAATAAAALDEDEPQDFSGVDTSAPVDDETDDGLREVSVEGIEGSMSEFDVRVTLENRAEDFDRCHDRMGGGGGRIVYRIHIESDGHVGRVKTVPIRSRNKKLVACYTEVVSSSHFPSPHGGYANVKWTTKVGRTSRKKKKNMLYDRPHRWDAPAGKRASR